MPDEFGDDNFDDIFDDLKTGRKQNHQFREVLGAKRPFSGREIFRVDIRPSRRDKEVIIDLFLEGPEFTFDEDNPSEEHSAWIEAAKANYRAIPDFFDLPTTIKLRSLAAIERVHGSFDNFYR